MRSAGVKFVDFIRKLYKGVRLIITFRTLLLLLAASYLLVACEDDPNGTRNIETYLSSAEAFLTQGQYRAAMIEIRNAFQLDPTSEAAIITSAKLNLRLGHAKQAYRQLESIKGLTHLYFESLVEAYIQSRKYNSALATLLQQESIFASTPIVQKLLTAQAYTGLRRYDDAEDLLAEVLDLEPDNLDAQLGEIRILITLGELETVEPRLNEILSANPEHVAALILRSAVYLRQGQLDLAEQALTSTVSALPVTDIYTRERAGVLRALISLLVRQGRSGEALVYQRSLAEAFPDAQQIGDHLSAVSEMVQESKFSDAAAVLDELESLAPDNETIGTLRGVLALLQGDDSAAENFFLDNVDVELASPRTLQLFATNQFRLDRPYRVVQILREQAKTSDNPEILALFGIAAIATDFGSEGAESLRRAIYLAPERARLSLILAHYLNRTDPLAALLEIEAAHSRKPADHIIRQRLLAQYLRLDKEKEARSFVDKLVTEDQESQSSHLISGSYYNLKGEYDKASDAFKKAITLDEETVTAYLGLAEAQMRSKEYTLAESSYRVAIGKDIESVAAYTGLLSSYLARGEIEQGIKTLSQFAEESEVGAPLAVISSYYADLNQETNAKFYLSQARLSSGSDRYTRRVNAVIYLRIANQNFQNQDYEQARSNVFTALSSYPANRQLLGLLAQIEIASESYTEAEKVITQMEGFHPGSRLLAIRKGDLALARGELRRAQISYELAWNMKTSDRLGNDLYTTYMDQNQVESAMQFLDEWQKEIPNSVVAVVARAQQYSSEGHTQKAIDAYKQILGKVPDSPTALNNLAWLYLETNEIEAALAVSETAYKLVPDNGSIVDTYGWVLFKANRQVEAIEVLNQAVRLRPDPQFQAHLDEVIKSSTGSG